jgi:transketolase
LDSDTILKAAKQTRGIIVCEEHTVIGGLASSIQEVVAENSPVKVVCLGIKNRFGQSGEPADLLKEYNLTAGDIEKAAYLLLRK